MSDESKASLREPLKSLGKTLFDGAVFLALIAALSYLVAFTEEFFYCKFFGIPYYLIVISKPTIALVGITLLFLIGGAFGLMYVLLSEAPNPDVPRRENLISGLLAALVAGLFLAQLRTSWLQFVQIGFAAVLLGIFWSRLRKQGSRWSHMSVGVVVVALVCAGSLGYSRAWRQKDFPVFLLSSDRQLVVLYSDGDSFVCTPLRKQTDQVDRTFLLLDRSTVVRNSTPLQVRRIGPLHLVSEAK